MPNQVKKAPTEKKQSTVEDFFKTVWGNVVKDDFEPFVNWKRLDETRLNEVAVIIEFTCYVPITYTNKWDREQLKMSCLQEGVPSIISGGKRLFAALKSFCMDKDLKPSELGLVKIRRHDSGFNTGYIIETV